MTGQGLELVAAHFSVEPITDDAAAVKARTLCDILGIGSLYVVRVGEAFAEVAHAANRRFYFVLTKRLMVRLAGAVGGRGGGGGLVGGGEPGARSRPTPPGPPRADAGARPPGPPRLIRFRPP